MRLSSMNYTCPDCFSLSKIALKRLKVEFPSLFDFSLPCLDLFVFVFVFKKLSKFNKKKKKLFLFFFFLFPPKLYLITHQSMTGLSNNDDAKVDDSKDALPRLADYFAVVGTSSSKTKGSYCCKIPPPTMPDITVLAYPPPPFAFL